MNAFYTLVCEVLGHKQTIVTVERPTHTFQKKSCSRCGEHLGIVTEDEPAYNES